MQIDPEKGFTSGVIKDPDRFVGRTELIRDCVKALNAPFGLIAVYGKRGVGKSSLLRQLQQMALGDYSLAQKAGLSYTVPKHPRRYLTVFYTCDSMIKDGQDLLLRLCNDQSDEDGLLRLIPEEGKEIEEFSRSREVSGGADLKVVSWGAKGVEVSKFAKKVPGDTVQTFRNFIDAAVVHSAKKRMKRDGLLIILDEFDVIADKAGIGSLIKSLSSDSVKFAICGIADDLVEIVHDHQSVERLLEEGALHVLPMSLEESVEIINTAEQLFEHQLTFEESVKKSIASASQGYPYFTQLLGKECVARANQRGVSRVTDDIFQLVLEDIRQGQAFPTLEAAYKKAIGDSKDREILLHLLAGQPPGMLSAELGLVALREARNDAADLDIGYVDQLIPRLVDEKYGPCLRRVPDRAGYYEFVNPVLRLYVNLRTI